MTTTLYLHCDTAGAWRWRDPDDPAIQPRVVRVSALMATPLGEEVWIWLIHDKQARFEPGAVAAHHITPQMAREQGEPPFVAFGELDRLLGSADAVVAYGWDFHRRAATTGAKSVGVDLVWPKEQVCAMRKATPVVKVPRQQPGGGFAYPKLVVAAEFFGAPVPRATQDPIDDGEVLIRAVRAIHLGCQQAAGA